MRWNKCIYTKRLKCCVYALYGIVVYLTFITKNKTFIYLIHNINLRNNNVNYKEVVKMKEKYKEKCFEILARINKYQHRQFILDVHKPDTRYRIGIREGGKMFNNEYFFSYNELYKALWLVESIFER